MANRNIVILYLSGVGWNLVSDQHDKRLKIPRQRKCNALSFSNSSSSCQTTFLNYNKCKSTNPLNDPPFLEVNSVFVCPLLQHLVTFSLQDGEVKNVEEAQSRLSLLARSDRLWSQEMVLEVGPGDLRLRDVQNQVCSKLHVDKLTFLHRTVPESQVSLPHFRVKSITFVRFNFFYYFEPRRLWIIFKGFQPVLQKTLSVSRTVVYC